MAHAVNSSANICDDIDIQSHHLPTRVQASEQV